MCMSACHLSWNMYVCCSSMLSVATVWLTAVCFLKCLYIFLPSVVHLRYLLHMSTSKSHISKVWYSNLYCGHCTGMLVCCPCCMPSVQQKAHILSDFTFIWHCIFLITYRTFSVKYIIFFQPVYATRHIWYFLASSFRPLCAFLCLFWICQIIKVYGLPGCDAMQFGSRYQCCSVPWYFGLP